MSKGCITCIFLFFLCFSLFAINAETVHNQDHYFITSGFVYLNIPVKELSDIVTDYGKYRDWALEGIDGKDPISAKFNIILSDMLYQEISRQFMLIFDLNIIWPFGSKGNKVYFDIITEFTSTGLIKSVEYRLSEPASMVPWASLSIEVLEHLTESKVYFECKVKLAWFIDMFFTLKGYKRNIETRIIQIMRNLKRYQYKNTHKAEERIEKDDLHRYKPKDKSIYPQNKRELGNTF